MIEDDSDSVDTITINEDDLFAIADDDNITLSSWNSPLTTSLNTSMYPSATLGTISSIGTTGATLSTSVTNNGLLWNNPTYTATASPYTVSNGTTGWTTYNNTAQVLRVSGDAEFDGDIKIKGVNLTDRLDAIEERLGILRPNNDLEGRWEKLKQLGEEYRKMEKEILEQEQMWELLKK